MNSDFLAMFWQSCDSSVVFWCDEVHCANPLRTDGIMKYVVVQWTLSHLPGYVRSSALNGILFPKGAGDNHEFASGKNQRGRAAPASNASVCRFQSKRPFNHTITSLQDEGPWLVRVRSIPVQCREGDAGRSVWAYEDCIQLFFDAAAWPISAEAWLCLAMGRPDRRSCSAHRSSAS
jgi:hypothetical protein